MDLKTFRKKFTKLKKRFVELQKERGTNSQYQELRDELAMYKFEFEDKIYYPAKIAVNVATFNAEFAYINAMKKIREERLEGKGIKNMKEEAMTRSQVILAEKLVAVNNLEKLMPIFNFLTFVERTIASKLRQ